MNDKASLKDQDQFTKTAFDEQTIHFNQLLKEAQEEHQAQRTAMLKAAQEQNLLLAKEKRDAEMRQRLDWAEQEATELRYTMTHDFMTENPATEQSMLAAHRVKPYHFKGLNQEQ